MSWDDPGPRTAFDWVLFVFVFVLIGLLLGAALHYGVDHYA